MTETIMTGLLSLTHINTRSPKTVPASNVEYTENVIGFCFPDSLCMKYMPVFDEDWYTVIYECMVYFDSFMMHLVNVCIYYIRTSAVKKQRLGMTLILA